MIHINFENENPKRKRNCRSENQKIYLPSYLVNRQEKPPFSHQQKRKMELRRWERNEVCGETMESAKRGMERRCWETKQEENNSIGLKCILGFLKNNRDNFVFA